MDEREMIHDYVASAPAPDARTRMAARAALQREMRAEAQTVHRRSMPSWRRIVPVLSAAVALVLASLTIVNPLFQQTQQVSAAAAVLRAASATAARQHGHVPAPGEYAYTRTEGAYFDETQDSQGHVWGALVRTTREAWIAPDGSGRIRQTTETPEFLVPADQARWKAAGSPPLTVFGRSGTFDKRFPAGGLAYPLDIDGFRHEQILRLADDPGALGNAIRAEAAKNSNPLGWEMLTIVGDLLSESAAPPALRASLYKVATTIPDISLVGDVADRAGRHGIGVAVTRQDLRLELVFDPKSSQLLVKEETLRVPSSDTSAPVGTPISYTLYLDSSITGSVTAR